MARVKNYLSLIKFSHTIFAMPFAMIGFFLGLRSIGISFHQKQQWNSWRVLGIRFLLVIGCMVFARSAAMAFNRYLDRRFDAQNPRTAIREIPSGIIKPQSALLFTIISCLAFV